MSSLIIEFILIITLIITLIKSFFPNNKMYISRKNQPGFFWIGIIAYIILLGVMINYNHLTFEQPVYIKKEFKTNGFVEIKGLAEGTKQIQNVKITFEDEEICSQIKEIKKNQEGIIQINFKNCSLETFRYYDLKGELYDPWYFKDKQIKEYKLLTLGYPN